MGQGGMILVFGSINMDLVARVRAIARPGETVLSRRADSFFGGKGANQAVAAARVGQGGPVGVAMAGAVGKDPFGQACLENLRANGVKTDAIAAIGEPTGCAFITVDESGENAITVASGANMAVTAAGVPDALLAQTSILVMQLEVPTAECLAVAQRARRNGTRVVWNFAPAPSETDRAAMTDLLAATDILIVNEHEARAIGSLLGDEAPGDEPDVSAALARTHDLTCVVTAGARGATAVAPDGARVEAAAKPIAPVDSTGAGDTFVGVFAVGLAEGLEIGEATRRACIAASLSCLKEGAQAGMPTREALLAELDEVGAS